MVWTMCVTIEPFIVLVTVTIESGDLYWRLDYITSFHHRPFTILITEA